MYTLSSLMLFMQGPSPKRKVQKAGRQLQKTNGEQLFEIIMSGKGALQVSVYYFNTVCLLHWFCNDPPWICMYLIKSDSVSRKEACLLLLLLLFV